MKRRIIIADDDPIVVNLVDLRLTMEGYDVFTATDGGAALSLIDRVEPAAAIIDIRMPVRDGLQVLSQLKSSARTKALPIMMLTGERDASAVTHALDAGAADYLVKPFKPDELYRRLARLIRKSDMVWTRQAQEPSWLL